MKGGGGWDLFDYNSVLPVILVNYFLMCVYVFIWLLAWISCWYIYKWLSKMLFYYIVYIFLFCCNFMPSKGNVLCLVYTHR